MTQDEEKIGKKYASKGFIQKIPIAWLIKTIVFGLMLAGAGAFFGLVLRWVGDGYVYLTPGSWDMWEALHLVFWALGALTAVAVTAGFVAMLLRPFWVAALTYLVSALALFLTFELSLLSFVVALIYFLIGLIYLGGVRAEIANRVKFSVWNIRGSQTVLLVVLVALVCTSLYFGYSGHIDRQGFTIPEDAVDWVVDMADQHLIDKIMPEGATAADREQALEEIRDFFANDVQSDIEPYEAYIPMGLAAIAFSVLMMSTFVASWVPILILSLLLFILIRTKVVRKRARAVEVTQLSLE
ncbi:MAG: hypothetical protein U9N44_07675 [Chloroflexota bacterium]|nr:hypothetical protein [Chloroflexota bacterium]